MLTIKDLHVQIENKTILNHLNLEIKPGEVHVVMGVNGAGKSTLVKTLANHYECEIMNGTIEYKNKNLLDLSVDERANEGIFLSFQNPVEVPGVNNSYFLKTALNEKRKYHNEEELDAMAFMKQVRQKIKAFDMDDKLLKRDLNDGFSGGEKKRNELLQLLMLEPEFIMLDEIDSGLDVDAIKTVANVINSMLDGKRSVLMITHYDRLLELIRPDFVHILSEGKIIKTGSYELALQLDKEGFKGLGIDHETQ
jgi:Fe-S cluster assembly ATP-binding protein